MTTNFAGEPITWRHDYAVKTIELSPWLTQTLSREEVNSVKDKLSALTTKGKYVALGVGNSKLR